MESPLISFIVIGCNQEQFVREAVEAAFAQTYTPLEIVLSDDCSDDRTFEVMKTLARAYKGPHHLILNKNHHRRSIGGHINKVMEISHGELIVIAAADDISLPHRTQVLYEAWEESGRKATSIHSGFFQINECGNIINEIYKNNNPSGEGKIVEQKVELVAYVQTLNPVVFGCTHAWTRKLFRLFGNLPEEVTHEDDALAFRSILAGRLFYVDVNLVKYRVHSNNMYISKGRRSIRLDSIDQDENRYLRSLKNRETMYTSFILDLETARMLEVIGEECFDRTVEEAKRLRRHFTLKQEYLESEFLGKCRSLYKLFKAGIRREELRFLYPRILPRPLFARCKLVYNYAALALKKET
jgi:glycosyltransferase involved in cell wall biosynthesis